MVNDNIECVITVVGGCFEFCWRYSLSFVSGCNCFGPQVIQDSFGVRIIISFIFGSETGPLTYDT